MMTKTATHTVNVAYETTTEYVCPTCGEKPVGTIEVFDWSIAYARITPEGTDYDGDTETDLVWDFQTTLEGEPGNPLVVCCNRHPFLISPRR